jgi:predicted TIM-barrel fold metal-dependent hydrolase
MSFTIDVHHHILPDIFWRATNDAHDPVGGILPAPWSKESALSYMDDAGIDVAITSISTPGVHMGDDSAARDLARRVNELSAQLMQERPDRFGGFAALPLPDVDGALRALEYALDVLKLDGVDSATALALFSLATAVSFHSNFADQNQMIHFLKNMMMAGGLLQIVAFGAGALSMDSRYATAFSAK